MALPYEVRVNYGGYDGCDYKLTLKTLQDFPTDDLKPYLRPMSSMTEKEKEELLTRVVGKKGRRYFYVMDDGTIDNNDPETQDINSFNVHWVNFGPESVNHYIDWLLARHFDFMGLIPMGIAEVATEGTY